MELWGKLKHYNNCKPLERFSELRKSILYSQNKVETNIIFTKKIDTNHINRYIYKFQCKHLHHFQ
jgi:hypothetical protein